MRFNVLHKPFDNAKARQAALYAIDQKEFLDANVGDPEYYKVCKSLFPCSSPYESTKGWDDKLSGQRRQGRAASPGSGLRRHAGGDAPPDRRGRAQQPRDRGQAAAREGRLKVDLQPMDWQTLVSRRAKKDAPSAGGWNIFFTSYGAVDVINPASTAFFAASCDKATFGWPCDAELERLRDAFAAESDPAKQKELAEQVQLRAAEYPTHAPLGQFTSPSAVRSNVTGMVPAPTLAMWGMEKKK